MNILLQKLDVKFKNKDLSSIDVNKCNIFASDKNDLMGIALTKELLLLHDKYFYSFRMKIENSGFLKPLLLAGTKDLLRVDKKYLEEYFLENGDNPYGIYNVLLSLKKLKEPNDLTQFPPLFQKKDKKNHIAAVEKLASLAEVGDNIFTFDRDSGLSSLIRKIDRGMWSHAAIIDENKNIYELTTSGLNISDFSSLYNPSLEIGLYRLKKKFAKGENQIVNEAFKKTMVDFKNENLKRNIHYSFLKVFLIYLKRKYNAPIPIPSPADMMYMNIFDLIGYA